MVKLLLIVLLLYLLFRAGRNLLRAAVRDGLMKSEDLRDSMSRPTSAGSNGRSSGGEEIEDAVWEDLP